MSQPQIDFLLCIFLALLLQVTAKRTNVPGMKQFRARRPNPYMGFPPRGAIMPPYLFSPYGYGYAIKEVHSKFLVTRLLLPSSFALFSFDI